MVGSDVNELQKPTETVELPQKVHHRLQGRYVWALRQIADRLENASRQPRFLLLFNDQCIKRQTAYPSSVDRYAQLSRALIVDHAGLIEMCSTRHLNIGTTQGRNHVLVDAGRCPAQRAVETVETNQHSHSHSLLLVRKFS